MWWGHSLRDQGFQVLVLWYTAPHPNNNAFKLESDYWRALGCVCTTKASSLNRGSKNKFFWALQAAVVRHTDIPPVLLKFPKCLKTKFLSIDSIPKLTNCHSLVNSSTAALFSKFCLSVVKSTYWSSPQLSPNFIFWVDSSMKFFKFMLKLNFCKREITVFLAIKISSRAWSWNHNMRRNISFSVSIMVSIDFANDQNTIRRVIWR